MNAEKTIRSQARQALKGNWVAAVSALLTAVVFYLLVFFIYSLIDSIFVLRVENGLLSKGSEPAYIIILCLTFLMAVAVSPVTNGFMRLCYRIQNDENANYSDVFYFFSGIKLYFSAIQFNILYALRKMLCFLIASVPYVLFVVAVGFYSFFSGTPALFGDSYYIVSAVLLTLTVIIGFIISLRFLPAQFIFAAGLDKNVFSANKNTVKGHYGDILKLVISFLPWFLLCFFVLPALYVVPYFFTGAATSTKWLFKIYKEGKTV